MDFRLQRMVSHTSSTYTPIPQDELRRIFDNIDANNDGNVDPIELGKTIDSQMGNVVARDLLVDSLFERGDKDHDGHITFDEFCDLYKRVETRTFFQKFFHMPPLPAVRRRAKHYWDDVKWCPPPIIIVVIVLCQCIIFIIDQKHPLKGFLQFNTSKKEEAWRYFTYSLLHVDCVHLIGNCCFQLAFGVVLEIKHGWRAALVYVFGVLAGSLASAIFEYSASLVGASAGAFALIFSWLADIFLNFSEQSCPVLSLIVIILITAWEIFMTTTRTSAVSLVAHVAGGIIGVMMGIIILENVKEHRYERIVRIIAIVFSILYWALSIFFNVMNIHT